MGCIINSLKSRTTDRVGSYRVTDCQKLSWVSVTPMVQRVQAWMFCLNIWFKDTSMKFDRIQEFQIWNHNSNQTFKRISWRPGWNMERRLNRLSQLMDLMISHWEAHLQPKNDGGMGEWGGEERARFKRNPTHLCCKKLSKVSVTPVVQRVETWIFFSQPLVQGQTEVCQE